MKNNTLTIVKATIIILIVLWMILFVVDYFRARQELKPLICLNEKTVELTNGSYYQCISFGYKYYVYQKDGEKLVGLGASFVKTDIEKEIGE